jgi:hypothetical protein
MLIIKCEDSCGRYLPLSFVLVVKNMAFQKYNHMDQSLFTRFVRLGFPYIELNAQGRARPSIAKLYNWRYRVWETFLM